MLLRRARNRVFLLSVVRSGTTFLGNALSHHPEIAVFGEIFFPSITEKDIIDFGWYHWLLQKVAMNGDALFPEVQHRLFLEYIDELQNRQPEKAILLDIKLEQMSWAMGSLYSAIFRQEHSFIILRRKNLLKAVVSSALMFQRIAEGDTLVHRDYVPEKRTVRLDPTCVIEEIREKSHLMDDYSSRLATLAAPYLEIEYESLIDERRDAELENLQRFIGVTPQPLSADIVKQNPYPLQELIENFEELSTALQHSEFAFMLDLPT